MIVFGFIAWLVAILDWLAHPFLPSPYSNNFGGSPVYRAFALFIGAPFIAMVAILILKKQPRNIVGLMLLAWAGGSASTGVSVALNPIVIMLISVPIAVWWGSLILSPFYFPDGRAFPRWMSPALTFYIVLSLMWVLRWSYRPARWERCPMPLALSASCQTHSMWLAWRP